MLSKNNFQERLRKMEQKNEHFSIRKLTVGAASVLIGLTFLGFSGHTVHADTTDASGVIYKTYQPEQKPEPEHEKMAPSTDDFSNLQLPPIPESKVNTVYYPGDENTNSAAAPTNSNVNAGQDASGDNGNENTTSANQAPATSDETTDASGVTYTKYQPEQKPEPNYPKMAPSTGGFDFDLPPIPSGVKYGPTTPDNITEHSETKTISRIVTVKNPLTGETSTLADQSVTYTRTVSYNNDTKETTYSDWKVVAGSPDFAAVTVPKFEGYTPSQSSIPAKTIDPNETGWVNSSDPVNITYSKYDEPVIMKPADPAGIASQEIDVKMPDSEDSTAYYYKSFDQRNVFGIKNDNGEYTWGVVTFDAQPIDSLLTGNDFTYSATGLRGEALPKVPEGYRAKIVDVQTVGGDLWDTNDIEIRNQLLDELDKKVAENPYELPTYTTPTGVSTKNKPITAVFKIAFERTSTSGTPLTQDDKPAFNGGVAGIPLTQDDKPAFNGGVAGTPLTQDDKPAFNGGVAGIPLTQDDKPAFNGGVPGIPETQPDKPAFNGGVPGIPETQPDLPVAPLPEEPETPTTPSDNNNVPGQPVDTNEGTVAPHPTDNPDNGDNSVETPVVHATEAVKADNTDDGVTAPVHAAAVAHNDEKKANTLPQTGAKATTAGVLGLMLASVGAIFGLAVTKKRKN